MKIVFYIVALFCVCSVTFAAEEGMNPTGEAFVKAFRANDLEGVVALYADDALLFPPDAMEAKGKEAIRKAWAGLMDAYTVQDLAITNAFNETQGDLSTGWGYFSMTLVPKAGGDPVKMEGRFSDVSKRINGKWLYIMDHASVPLPPPPQKSETTK